MKTMWDVYLRYFAQFNPILSDMANRGLPIDNDRRLALKKVIEEEDLKATEAIKALIPMEVMGGKQKNGLKRAPKDTEGYVEREFVIEKEEKCGCTKKTRPTCSACGSSGLLPVGLVVKRFVKLTDFNPNSSLQVKKFMKHLKHPVPKHAKRTDAITGESSETTEVKELERLFAKTKHPIYPLLVDKRQLSKIMGTYVEGWAPSRDNRIHTTFTFKPATWQTSCCAAWTLVTGREGVMPICNVRVGDDVFTHKGRWKEVTAVWVHPPQAMFAVYFENGHVLTCTLLHRLLCFVHGDSEELVDGRECSKGTESFPRFGLPNTRRVSERITDDSTQYWGDTETLYGPAGKAQAKQSSLLTVEDAGQESDVREEGSGDVRMEGRSVRWARILDILEGRQEAVCASHRYGTCVGEEATPIPSRRTSYRRGQAEQSHGQFSADDSGWSPDFARNYGPQYGSVRIAKIVSLGNFPVHDITVEGDESYESCGVLSHNSRAPNVQNGMKRGRTEGQKRRVKAFNAMQRAEPGHVMINFDAKSFHAQTTACEAGLADYLRLAKIDIHSFNACHFVRHSERHNLLSMTDSDLKGLFGELKKSDRIWTNGMTFKEIRDGKTKSAGLGIGFGMRGKKLYQMYQEDFESQKEAEGIWNMIMRDLFPGLLKWQDETKHRAAEDKKLVSRFGAVRRFYDVERWDRKRQQFVGGDQAEAAIAFLPAANAFGMMREMLLQMESEGVLERFEAVNAIHDSIVFHPLSGDAEECIRTVIPFMQAPSGVLKYAICPDGLQVDAEASVGEDLANMVEYKG